MKTPIAHPVLDLLVRVGFRAGTYNTPTDSRVGYAMYDYPIATDTSHLFIAMDDNHWALVANAWYVDGEPVSAYDTIERTFEGDMDEAELTKLVEGTPVEPLLRAYKLGLLQQNLGA